MKVNSYTRQLEFLFLDFFMKIYPDLTQEDWTKIQPVFEKCAENNFKAAFILSVCYSENGLILEHLDIQKSESKSLLYGEKALKMAHEEKVELRRAKNIIHVLTA